MNQDLGKTKIALSLRDYVAIWRHMMLMKVKLSFTADLRYLVKGGDGAVVVEMRDPLSLRGILESLGVPPDKVVFGEVDKQLKGLDYVPRDGETVVLLPPISGG